MIIIFLMIILSFILINKKIDNKVLTKKLSYIYVIALLFQIILFIVYRYELYKLNMEVYYSDATDYWNATLSILNGRTTAQYNGVFYYTCALVQLLSPFIWAGWNNLFNIMCINISILLVVISMYEYLKKDNINIKLTTRQVLLYSILNLFNPLIYYSLMRNLKDAEFLLLTVYVAYDFCKFVCSNNYKHIILYFVRLFICSILLFGIRPWGFLIGFIPVILLFFRSEKRVKKKISIILIILTTFMIFALYHKISSTLIIWVPVVINSALKRGFFQTVLGIFKLILGPGPVRSLFGEEYFTFYIKSGNYMCMIGSLIWWFEFLIFLFPSIRLTLKNKKNSIKPLLNSFLLVFLLLFFTIYVMQYGGSAEIRFRGVLYVILSAFFCTKGILKYRIIDFVFSTISVFLLLCINVIFL